MIKEISAYNLSFSAKRKTSVIKFPSVQTEGNDIPRINNQNSAKERWNKNYKIGLFLYEDAKSQYHDAQLLANEIKSEIRNNIKSNNGQKYRTLKENQGQKIIISADCIIQDNSITIAKITKMHKNGSIDTIDLNTNGDVIRITNGIVEYGDKNKTINEEFFFNNGELIKAKLNSTIKDGQTYTEMEAIYSEGEIAIINEYISRNKYGQTSVGITQILKKT